MGTNEPVPEPPLLRSIDNRHKSYVRFINTTRRRVQLLWINYSGQAVSYGILSAGDDKVISTYVTHPWIFLEPESLDRFLVKGQDVFYPEPWFAKYRGVPRSEIPRQPEVDPVYITLPMYSLVDIALRSIKSLLRDEVDAFCLEIPKQLQMKLARMRPVK